MMNTNAASTTAARPVNSGALEDREPNELVSEVEQLGIEWANADEAANLLEETKKTLLAQYTVLYQKGTGAAGAKPVSMANAEALAMADARYHAHIETMVKARTQANRLRVRYDSGRIKIELLRSLIARQREAARISSFRT
jgi:hypothetical protein